MFQEYLPFQIIDNYILLLVKASPNAAKNNFGKMLEIASGKWAVKIMVTAKPKDNEANEAIIKFLSEFLKIAKSKIAIITGNTSKIKTVKINENSPEVVIRLKSLL
ncbi:DUF167 domain-containing protein [Rickettsiales endosymbiont of Stachyamoeba lipophora]|uniref:DUF167 domain-containing protein n=1 Tax=Rickettsiales endosymbiont of Stachyamoeba lipophora TaxID=2486578 RepID=UPI0013DDDA51|nr:DUF167 domain-containing protein [Rickettsiales endosymbiont of Stachyamoeba lipophora]